MRNKLKVSSVLVLLGLILGTYAFAQSTVSTDVVGFTTLGVRAKAGSANALTLLSLNVARPKVFQGTVGTKSLDGSGRSVITQPTAVFTADSYKPGTGTFPSNRHYLLIKNGSNAGAWSEIVGNTTTSITVTDNFNDLLSDGVTQFEIRPFWTLSTALPGGGGLQGGTSGTAADNVTVIRANGTLDTFFYHSSNGRWQTGISDASHAIIAPSSGISFTRKQTSAVNIVITGEVLTTPILADVLSGGSSKLTYLANPYPLASKTLSTSGLVTGNSATGLVGGSSATAADTVTIYNVTTGSAVTYYYNTTNNRWQSGISDASNVTIPDTAVLVVNRKSNRGAFEWYIPVPSMNL